MNFILIAVLVLGAIALIAALVLFGVSKKFAVEEDPRSGPGRRDSARCQLWWLRFCRMLRYGCSSGEGC